MITHSELRQNLDDLLDQVILTGKPIEIKRKNKILQISVEPSIQKKQDPPQAKVTNYEPEGIIYTTWEKERWS